MNVSKAWGALFTSAWVLNISLTLVSCGPRKEPPPKQSISEAQYKQYLDQIWIRANRAWGVPERKLNVRHMKLAFDIDRSGKASALSLENTSSGSPELDRRVLRTIEAASPFPVISENAPEHVHVRADLEVKDGLLSIAFRIPEIESANGTKSTIVENASDKETANALLGALSGSNIDAKHAALEEIKNMGPGAKEATAALIMALKDKDDDTRYAAFELIRQMGPDAIGTLPELLRILNGASDNRVLAAEAIASLGPAARSAVPSLMATLNEKGSTFHMSLHLEATRALRNIDPSTNKACLEKLLPDLNESTLFTWQEDTFAEYGSDAMPYLLKAVQSPASDRQFVNAAKVLGKMGALAVPAVPFIAAGLKGDEDVSEAAAQSLEQLGPKAKAAVPSLISALKSSDDHKWRVIDALGAIGKAAGPAIPALQDLAERDKSNRDLANEAIRNIKKSED